MKFSVRRSAADPEADVAGPESAAENASSTGKGRPTPKRRDVTGVRGPVHAPKTRKEALARQKQLAKEAKTARRTPATQMTPAQRRAALRAGDPSVLPRRDQGDTRKLARDYVDAHRLFSNYLLWLFPLMIISYLIPYIQILVIAVFLALLVEWYLVGGRIRKMAIERFGRADGGSLSIGFYAGSRAYLPRRWRLPAPQVERGEQI